MRTIRTYPSLPSLPSRGSLPPMVGVVLPLARINLITNPSFETNTTGWTASGGSIARSTAQQYHGTYSLAITPTAGNNSDGAFCSSFTLTANTDYAYSCKVKIGGNGIGKTYALSIQTTSNSPLHTTYFTATGRWQWITGVYHETPGAARRLWLNKVQHSGSAVIYIDGAQVEAITDGILQATTYIDGDQLGLLPGQQPPAYGWNGTPHASTSYRTALTRAGGYVLNLRDAYGFILTGLIGLGMAAPNNVSIPYSVLDGARYLRTTKPPRTLSLPGRFFADTIDEQMRNQSAMRAAFDRDAVPVQQPLQLYVEPQDECGNTIGDFAFAQCLYAGGLEGNESNYPAEDAAPTFTMYVPFLLGGDAGAALSVQQNVTTNYIAHRSASGVWDGLDTSLNGIVNALAIGPDGNIYAGGNFTNAGGVANADYIAVWNGSAWSALGTGADAQVNALAFDASGNLYAGGDFANIGGVAAAKVAMWNGAVWSALGTGLTGGVSPSCNVLLVAADGNLYAGGAFTDAGGSGADYLARWNGSAWFVVGGAAAINAQVYALAEDKAGNIYVGGAFTNAGGNADADRIAKWDGGNWRALGTGADNIVYALAFGPNGILYAGGSFTTVGGLSISYIALWNGTNWYGLGTGVNNTVVRLFFGLGGTVLYASGDFTTAGGITLPDKVARWNGSSWLPLDADFAGSAAVATLVQTGDGQLYVGLKASGGGTSAVNTAVTNSNKNYVWPIVTINGPTSGTSRIYQIVNYSTGNGIWFNLTLGVGEVVTLNFNPQQQSFVSTFQGDITSKILPGSNVAQFYLAPGANTISFFAASGTVTATVNWQRRYNGPADLVS